MAAPVVGVVTIGQSPRTDVVPDITRPLPPGTQVIERGALDRVGPAELAGLAPVCGEDLLVTRGWLGLWVSRWSCPGRRSPARSLPCCEQARPAAGRGRQCRLFRDRPDA
jgi:AroM protein